MFSQGVAGRCVDPAPLDPHELGRSLAPFGSSRMLPRAAYLDPEVLAWERQHVFGRWLCVGRSADLPSAPGLKAVSIGGSGVLLSRDEAGVLRAFENACRHRGHELLPCGATSEPRAIVCPYHAWTYAFDGSLRGAPGFKRVPEFEPAEHGLFEIPVADWHGWLFVDPSGRAGDF